MKDYLVPVVAAMITGAGTAIGSEVLMHQKLLISVEQNEESLKEHVEKAEDEQKYLRERVDKMYMLVLEMHRQVHKIEENKNGSRHK